MAKIVYIDYLDWTSILIALASKFFYKHVGYHNANKFFSKASTRQFLLRFGIKWFSHTNLSINSWVSAYSLNNSLTDAVLYQMLLKNPSYLNMKKKLMLDELGEKKLNAALRKELLKNWIYEGTTSFSLMETLFSKDDFIRYFPSTYENYLLGLQYKRCNKVIGIHVPFRLIGKIVLNILSFFRKNINYRKDVKKNFSSLNNCKWDKNSIKIGYFPHSGLKYGE